MLHPGMWVKTSYDSGPYLITEVIHDCMCPCYLDNIEGDDFPSPPHVHCTVKKPGDKKPYFLGGYNEHTLVSVWSDDYLTVLEVPDEGTEPNHRIGRRARISRRPQRARAV